MLLRSEVTDTELLAACRAGNRVAFGAFYERHRAVLLSFLMRRVRDPELAADLVAESFAAALSAALDVRRELPTVPVAWLFGIARNLIIDATRRRQVEDEARRRLGMERLELDDRDIRRIEELAASTDFVAELQRRIPAAEWDAFRAYVLDEQSYGQIAGQFRCSEALARKRVSRARSNLRLMFGGRSA